MSDSCYITTNEGSGARFYFDDTDKYRGFSRYFYDIKELRKEKLKKIKKKLWKINWKFLKEKYLKIERMRKLIKINRGGY